jgi:hypothetical protein
MVLTVGTAPSYTEVTPTGEENPKTEGWFELEGSVYRKSADSTVITGKTYYARG